MRSPRRGAVARTATLDELDRALIEALQADGRETFRNIARRLDVAEGTIRNRYERLTAAGVLDVVGVTNPLALGFDASAMIGVTTSGRPQAVAEAVAELEDVSYVVIVAGRFDLMLEVVCRDHQHLLDATARIRAVAGVLTSETFVHLGLAKQSYALGQLPGPRD